MASVDLLFAGEPLHQPVALVFGDDGSSPVKDAIVSGDLALPALAFSSVVHLGYTIAAELPLPVVPFSSEVRYVSGAARPMVAQAVARWQDTRPQGERIRQRFQDAVPMVAGAQSRYQDAERLSAVGRVRWRDANRQLRQSLGGRFQDGVALGMQQRERMQNAIRLPNAQRVRFQEALPVSRGMVQRFQDGRRSPNAQNVRWQDARPSGFDVPSTNAAGVKVSRGWGTRYQDAHTAPPGRSVLGPPVQPPRDPCYVPSADLVFEALMSDDTDLVFVCEAHGGPDPEPGETVVVPVRRIYTVINSATLKRVDGGAVIPTVSMSLTIDVDSWTWSFSARTPGDALPQLEPVAGAPVEVEAMINGAPYRAIIESISRDRVFARSDLVVSGRGRAAVLDAPYSPVMAFGNPLEPRTVKQLANDVLTLNGVSLGWNVDDAWAPDDWLVPAGVFSHQGTYISAINAIAAAAGAYVQPHATAKALQVLRRYPAKPWEWGDVVPDYELPSDVVQKEGIVWSDKPQYNRVFVRGMKAGILGQATRMGTAGDREAPMVTDQLITNAIGARQRALPALADVGRQAAVSLRLPVLAETGVITPGKFVRYVDGGLERIGLVRSTSVETQRAEKKLTIWQTIGVETHVNV